MNYYISVDLEGLSGFRSNAEGKRNLDLIRQHGLACIRGISSAADTSVRIKSFHHDLPEGLPGNVLPTYATGRLDFDLPLLDATYRGLLFLGFHGLEPECGFGHSYRWPYLLLNGRRVGEITIQMLLAATMGVPTLFFAGDRFGVEEAEAIAPGLVTLTLRPGIHCDEGELDPSLMPAIQETAKRAVASTIPAPKIADRYRIEVPMRQAKEADMAEQLGLPITRQGNTIAFESPDFAGIYRFLMVDCWKACDMARNK
jgi:D-amino peptidase